MTGPGTTNPNGVGLFTATCSGAEDNAGNSGSASVTYDVVYGGFVRFLQPINNTAHELGNNPDVSTLKAGSTVPVKFQIKLTNGTIVLPTSAEWVMPQKRGSTGQPVDETVYTEPATVGLDLRPERGPSPVQLEDRQERRRLLLADRREARRWTDVSRLHLAEVAPTTKEGRREAPLTRS